jgi:uncharacterized membrane-anchored protein
MNTMDNVIGRVPLLARYILAALVLCGLIVATVVQRAAILRSGQEARLEVVPVDPRDLFRGDYVVLGYRIGTVDMPKDVTTPFTRGQQVFVTLRPDASSKAQAVAISAERPAVFGTDIVISGVVSSTSLGGRIVDVRYGLESYFVPEGEGKKIELTPKALLEVVAAVAPSGRAAIKRLLIDGKPVYDEPPY